jgi:hypothetical protein
MPTPDRLLGWLGFGLVQGVELTLVTILLLSQNELNSTHGAICWRFILEVTHEPESKWRKTKDVISITRT